MNRRFLLSLTISALALSACNTLPVNQQQVPSNQTVQNQANRPVLGSALIKRPLLLQKIDGKNVPVAAISASGGDFGTKQVATTISARADIAIGRPGMGAMYYYGGGEFNQYQIQYAEESIHKAATGKSLLDVYNQDVKPLLSEWDSTARMVESRASVNGTDEEWIYLPGKDGEPVKLNPLYVFRFSSTPKKETLNVYVLKGEIRVHRMIWGEPSIDISKVKIDSDEALEIARKAFASKSSKPGYPVYPEMQEPNMKIIYDIPGDLKWNLNLNQQDSKQIRYFLNFSYQKDGQGGMYPQPVPMPMPLDATMAKEAEAMAPAYVEYYYGSIEIDAISGAIKSMNRPVFYYPYPMPVATPGVVEGSSGSSGSGEAVSGGAAGTVEAGSGQDAGIAE